jgi:hypothetical protein
MRRGNYRIQTVELFSDADYCGHVDPDANFDSEPFASMPDEELDDQIGEFQDNHIHSGDMTVCLLSPAGTGVQEWVPAIRRQGKTIQRGYWEIIQDVIVKGGTR